MAGAEADDGKDAARERRLRDAGIPPVAEMRAILQRAQDGDESALPDVRRLLEHGRMVDAFGDAAEWADKSLVNSWCGSDRLSAEAALAKMGRLRESLAGENPTPIEKLLAGRIASCWLQCAHADGIAAANVACADQAAIRRRQDSAHKRLMTAIRTLATVRKLALPTLQINLGNQQLITAGSAGRLSPPAPPAPALPASAAPRADGAGPA